MTLVCVVLTFVLLACLNVEAIRSERAEFFRGAYNDTAENQNAAIGCSKMQPAHPVYQDICYQMECPVNAGNRLEKGSCAEEADARPVRQIGVEMSTTIPVFAFPAGSVNVKIDVSGKMQYQHPYLARGYKNLLFDAGIGIEVELGIPSAVSVKFGFAFKGNMQLECALYNCRRMQTLWSAAMAQLILDWMERDDSSFKETKTKGGASTTKTFKQHQSSKSEVIEKIKESIQKDEEIDTMDVRNILVIIRYSGTFMVSLQAQVSIPYFFNLGFGGGVSVEGFQEHEFLVFATKEETNKANSVIRDIAHLCDEEEMKTLRPAVVYDWVRLPTGRGKKFSAQVNHDSFMGKLAVDATCDDDGDFYFTAQIHTGNVEGALWTPDLEENSKFRYLQEANANFNPTGDLNDVANLVSAAVQQVKNKVRKKREPATMLRWNIAVMEVLSDPMFSGGRCVKGSTTATLAKATAKIAAVFTDFMMRYTVDGTETVQVQHIANIVEWRKRALPLEARGRVTSMGYTTLTRERPQPTTEPSFPKQLAMELVENNGAFENKGMAGDFMKKMIGVGADKFGKWIGAKNKYIDDLVTKEITEKNLPGIAAGTPVFQRNYCPKPVGC